MYNDKDLFDIIWKVLMLLLVKIFNINSLSEIISFLGPPLEQINSIDQLTDINEKIQKSEIALSNLI